MSSIISVGKYTLESLTSGMYSNSKDLYREYIQNSVDAIDTAVSCGTLRKGSGWISINIDPHNKQISIEDNGIGLTVAQAFKKLSDIGNSDKVISNSRGFRGIGRLAGLSYCDKLTFVTSACGEAKRVMYTFDCMKLKQMLVPGMYMEYDLPSVMTEVTKFRVQQETEKRHYFKVILEGVENIDGILDVEIMKSYLSQVAPVPFQTSEFSWKKEVHKPFRDRKDDINEYNIFVKENGLETQIFKSYTNAFLTDKYRKIVDELQKIEVREILDPFGNELAIVWYGISNFVGTILDENKKGFRYRKGNILIGDKSTLNCIFKENRFNGWFQGEIYVVDPRIIPNARRDDFERNSHYNAMINELKKLGDDLSKRIRNISIARNYKNAKVLNDAEHLIDMAQKSLIEGFNSQKEQQIIAQSIDQFSDEIESFETVDEYNNTRKIEMFKKLNILSGLTKGTTNFKMLNISSKFSIEQKKLLDKVFEVITECTEKTESDRIISYIIKKL